MSFKSKFKYIYLFILIPYAVSFVFFRPRPQLNFFAIKGGINQPSNYEVKKNVYIVNPPNNKVSVGESFSIKDNENWYQVIQLSFWRKEYVNLDFLRSQLKITDLNVKSINRNNYALATLQGEEIVYSCMKNSNEFYYSIFHGIIIDSFDINHWIKQYIKNLNFIFYSFRPRNYECFLVLTTNIKFFENSEFEINKKIFKKFIYE